MTARIIKIASFLLIFLCFGIIQAQSQALDFVNAAGDTLLHVNNDGKVGIGTTAPAKALHVKAVQNEIARFETTSGNSFLSLQNGTGQWANLGRFKNGTDDYFFLDLDGGGFGEFIVTNSGRVGIGTGFNPTALSKLHVASNNRYAGYFTSDSLSHDTDVIHAEYIGVSADREVTAVYGLAVANPGWGIGGDFRGGFEGVLGQANENSVGENRSRFGVRGYGGNSSGNNYGVWGQGFGGTVAYGVYGQAFGAITRYAVYASGNLAYTGNFINASDAKLKENIRPLTSALAKIRQLNGRRYNFTKQSQYASMSLAEGEQYGLIAQEVEQVLPELVVDAVHPGATDPEGRETGEPINYKGVKYLELIPLLIEAIKEQQAQIEALEAQVAQLRGR